MLLQDTVSVAIFTAATKKKSLVLHLVTPPVIQAGTIISPLSAEGTET